MHVKRDYFKCDTCGCEKEVDGDWLFCTWGEHGVKFFENCWIAIDKEYFLCPECSKAFREEWRRHEEKLTELVGKTATKIIMEGAKHGTR